MIRVIKKEPDKSVVKQTICDNCGATLEYVPRDVETLWSGTDISGGPDGAKGFRCPECGDRVILEQW